MLLKIFHRLHTTRSFLTCVCRYKWIDNGETSRKLYIYRALINNGFLPKGYRIEDLNLEAKRSGDGSIYWTLNKLSRARDKWVIFVQIVVFSKRKL